MLLAVLGAHPSLTPSCHARRCACRGPLQVAAEEAVRRATEFGIHKLDIVISGTGAGRETAVRTLQNMGMDVGTIKDITPTPHNGCRPKKRRRG